MRRCCAVAGQRMEHLSPGYYNSNGHTGEMRKYLFVNRQQIVYDMPADRLDSKQEMI